MFVYVILPYIILSQNVTRYFLLHLYTQHFFRILPCIILTQNVTLFSAKSSYTTFLLYLAIHNFISKCHKLFSFKSLYTTFLVVSCHTLFYVNKVACYFLLNHYTQNFCCFLPYTILCQIVTRFLLLYLYTQYFYVYLAIRHFMSECYTFFCCIFMKICRILP